VASQYISPDLAPEKWSETSPLFGLVSSGNRLVLLGDPGSGKSTLVSWIAWNLSQDRDNRWKQALNSRIPIVMVLRELSLDHVNSWDSLLEAYFKHWTGRMLGRARYASNIQELFETGRVMIILDGLDEIANVQIQTNLRKAVWEGMLKFKDCVWLLTSRVVGYLNYHEGQDPMAKDRGGEEKLIYAQLRYVAPFTDCQIKKFAQNWFSSRDQSAARASEDSSRLNEAIHSNPYTLRLARIPNLLMMMALIHRERARLPHGRALLYTDIANAYLQSIDENRRIEHLGYSLRDQKLWLGRIGFEMQMRRHKTIYKHGLEEEREILVEGRDVRHWVINAMSDAGRVECNEEVAKTFLDEICRRSGLLLPRGEDQFSFTHLSFQEFFAAVFFMQQFVRPPRSATVSGASGAGRNDLHSYVENPMWHETLVFLVELVFTENPDWLEELLFCFFGEDFSEVVPRSNMKTSRSRAVKPPLRFNGMVSCSPRKSVRIKQDRAADSVQSRATLLARLSVDPHAGFSERNLKQNAITRCCTFEVGEQKRAGKTICDDDHYDLYLNGPANLQSLLWADQSDIPLVWVSFVEALRKAKVTKFSLCGLPRAAVIRLADLNFLRKLDLTKADIVDLSPLSTFRLLDWLLLWNTHVSDVSPLAGLKNLKHLQLPRTPVKDLRLLAELTGLKRLNLYGTLVEEVGPLSSLRNLQELNLRDTNVNDIRQLITLTKLENIYLRKVPVTDFNPLSELTGLQMLDLRETLVSDLEPLAALTGLKWLDLGKTLVSDLGPLTTLASLQTLNLGRTKVSDVGPLTSLTSLEWLNLGGTQVSDVGPLTSLTSLKWLNLGGTQISEVDVSAIRNNLPKCEIARNSLE